MDKKIKKKVWRDIIFPAFGGEATIISDRDKHLAYKSSCIISRYCDSYSKRIKHSIFIWRDDAIILLEESMINIRQELFDVFNDYFCLKEMEVKEKMLGLTRVELLKIFKSRF